HHCSEHRWAAALQVRHGGSQPDVGSDRSQPGATPQKGGPVSRLCAQKLARLQTIVAERAAWAEPLAQVKRLHGWVLEVEHLLDESLVPAGEVVSNITVGTRLDSWRERMSTQLTEGPLSELERECLTEF